MNFGRIGNFGLAKRQFGFSDTKKDSLFYVKESEVPIGTKFIAVVLEDATGKVVFVQPTKFSSFRDAEAFAESKADEFFDKSAQTKLYRHRVDEVTGRKIRA